MPDISNNPNTAEQDSALADQIRSNINDFAPHFQDMLFMKGTETGEYVKQIIYNTSVKKLEEKFECPQWSRPVTYDDMCIEVKKIEGDCTEYDPATHTITVRPNFVKYPWVILHELIHIHEHFLNEVDAYYRDTLYWALYKRLRGRIPDLDKIIEKHAHLYTHTRIRSYGGIHSMLFLLKSFDLDIAFEYPLGAVYGYGISLEFGDFKYT